MVYRLPFTVYRWPQEGEKRRMHVASKVLQTEKQIPPPGLQANDRERRANSTFRKAPNSKGSKGARRCGGERQQLDCSQATVASRCHCKRGGCAATSQQTASRQADRLRGNRRQRQAHASRTPGQHAARAGPFGLFDGFPAVRILVWQNGPAIFEW